MFDFIFLRKLSFLVKAFLGFFTFFLVFGNLVGKAHEDETLQKLIDEVGPVEFNQREVQTFKLDNGIEVFFLPNPELPVIQLSLWVGYGTAHQTDFTFGTGSFAVNLVKDGGHYYLTPSSIDQIVEERSIRIGASVSDEYSTIDLGSLKEHWPLALRLFYDCIRNPRFDQERFELKKNILAQAILKRNERPAAQAQREFFQVLLGEENLWAKKISLAELKQIERSDLIQFHKKYFVAPNFKLAVSGDISLLELKKDLQKTFGQLPRQPGFKKPQLAKANPKLKGAVHFIDNPKLNQSSVFIGHKGNHRFHPDKFAIILANQILGGSTFSSRLGNQIRSKMGLAYSIYSQFGLKTEPDLFRIVFSTRSDATVQAVQAAKVVLQELQTTKPVTQAELDKARQALLRSLIFQNVDAFEHAKLEMIYLALGYPKNYLYHFAEKIGQVDLVEVQQAFKKHFFPNQLTILIVGNKKNTPEINKLGSILDRESDLN